MFNLSNSRKSHVNRSFAAFICSVSATPSVFVLSGLFHQGIVSLPEMVIAVLFPVLGSALITLFAPAVTQHRLRIEK